MDLPPGIFRRSPDEIARGLKRAAEGSRRTKGTKFQSAMSMLNLYVNRAGRALARREPRSREIDFAAQFESAEFLTLGILYAKDARFAGGFGIYDAPEPWGPWTTIFHTEAWDVGPGETSSLPPKWMSKDGRTLHLVFSGDDSFSVRKLTLAVAD